VAPTKRTPIFRNTSNEVREQGAKSSIAEIGAVQTPIPSPSHAPKDELVTPQAPPETYMPESPTDYWQKITIAFRREQVEELQKILGAWEYNEGVTITLVELTRLATDEIIRAAKTEKESVWRRVKKQAEREYSENPKSKHSKSKALKIRLD
jgi:hypothetical protein